MVVGESDVGKVIEHGRRMRKDVGPEPALEILDGLLAGDYGTLDRDQRPLVYGLALKCLATMQAWKISETRAREAIASYPSAARFWQHLGQALLHQNRLEEAEETLEQALRLAPARTEPRNLLALIAASRDRPARSVDVRPWPRRTNRFEDPRALIQRYVLRGRPATPLLQPDSVIMAMGSCFAGNLARRLENAGRPVNYETIGEEVNSTYANRFLLDWIERGVFDETTETMDQAFGPAMRTRMLGAVRESDVFVLTLGVAPCFFHRTTGRFAFTSGNISETARQYLHDHHVMRTTTVAENVDNIRAILATLKRIAERAPKVVLTVSPVPLAGTTEFDTAVEADCISKSTLRLACHELISAQSDRTVVYWPSFEIVRWFGAHYGRSNPPVYGADDGNSHHVSAWLVDLIVEAFLEYYRDDDLRTRPSLVPDTPGLNT